MGTLNGKSIKVTASTNKKYPASQGWFVFVFHGWTYYIRKTKTGLYTFRMNSKGTIVKGAGGSSTTVVHGGSTTVVHGGKVSVSTLYGNWGLNFPGLKFSIVFKPGKITLNGKSIKVTAST